MQLKKIYNNHWILLGIYILIAVLVSAQMISLGHNQQFNWASNDNYTSYNNYVIFKYSFLHLIDGKDMYILYESEYFDLYKYSPTFALFMGIFSYLPDWLGLTLWNGLNIISLFFAIKMLPFKKGAITVTLLLIIIELVTSTQNSQSNGLMAALMIGAFAFMNRGKVIWATLFIVLATYIKIYGAVAFAFFFLYPDKVKFIIYSIIWSIVALLLPLLATDYSTLIEQYISWGNLLANDQSASYGLSVMGWLNKIFGIVEGKNIVMLIGVILFFVPFIKVRHYKETPFRLLILAYTLIWVIIFNHKAESATFIIAMCGIMIWYFALPPATWRKVVLICSFIFVSLSTTELFLAVRDVFVDRYAIKPFACIAVWVIALFELLFYKHDTDTPYVKTLQLNNM